MIIRIVHSYIGYCLKKFGFEIIYAEDGFQALVILGKMQPDLIFLDVDLPWMNGLVLCLKLKSEDKTENIPVVFVTVENTERDKIRGREAGADGYIVKPFTSEEISEAVRTFLPPEQENQPTDHL